MTPHEVRDRVRARFPARPPLPDRPRLDQLIDEARLGLVYDEDQHGYRWPTRAADTKGLASRQATITASAGPQLVGRPVRPPADRERGHPVVPGPGRGRRPDRPCHRGAVRALRRGRGGRDPGVDRDHAGAGRRGGPALGHGAGRGRRPEGSRDAAGLAALVQRSLPAVDTAVAAAVSGAPRAPAGPADRTRATGPLRPPGHAQPVDGPGRPPPPGDLGARAATARHPGRHRRQTPTTLAAPGQFFRLDAEWIDSRPPVTAAGGTS